MRLKKKESLSLKQGGMLVVEYRDRFIELSRYAPEEVADDSKKQELLGGFGWTASLPADVAHFSVLPAAFRQSYCLGIHAQRAGGAEEEGRHSRTVREPHSPPLYLTAGSSVPSRRPDRRLWPAAAVSVPTTAILAVSALSSAVSAPRAADSTPWIPAAPSDDSRWYAREAQCTSHPREQHLL
jgi:hypothetical protein